MYATLPPAYVAVCTGAVTLKLSEHVPPVHRAEHWALPFCPDTL